MLSIVFVAIKHFHFNLHYLLFILKLSIKISRYAVIYLSETVSYRINLLYDIKTNKNTICRVMQVMALLTIDYVNMQYLSFCLKIMYKHVICDLEIFEIISIFVVSFYV